MGLQGGEGSVAVGEDFLVFEGAGGEAGGFCCDGEGGVGWGCAEVEFAFARVVGSCCVEFFDVVGLEQVEEWL